MKSRQTKHRIGRKNIECPCQYDREDLKSRARHESDCRIRRGNMDRFLPQLVLAGVCALASATNLALGADTQNSFSNVRPTALAKVGSRDVTEEDVDNFIGREAFLLKVKLYTLRIQAIESMIQKELLSDESVKLHLSESDLLSSVVWTHVSAADIDREFANDYESLVPLGEVVGRYRVKLSLEDHAREEAVRLYLEGLKARANVKILLTKPEYKLQTRTSVCTLGKPDAKHRLTVFLDYECPYCRSLAPILKDVLENHNGGASVSIAIKHLPLPQHENSFQASIAAFCSARQNKFSSMHDKLFAAENHSASGLAAIAERAGLNLNAFQACVNSEEAKDAILQDIIEARRNGVGATPSLFLDGEALNMSSVEDLRARLEKVGLDKDSASTSGVKNTIEGSGRH